MGLPKPLAALDAHLRDENARVLSAVRGPDRRRGLVPLPPVPENPEACRWCGGRLRALLDGGPLDYCQRGCARVDEAPFLNQCSECGRDFQTGKTMAAACHECERRDAREQPNEGVRPANERTYAFSRTRRGGYRD